MLKHSLLATSCLLLASCTDTSPTTEANSSERAALAAGSALPQPGVAKELLSCEPIAGMTPYCGYHNPEDLVHIPNTDLLIVSEMGEFMADSPGKLSLLNMTSGARETLAIDWSVANNSWGDAQCTRQIFRHLAPMA